jgi:predicted MFS family arabinose efflux permease
MRLLPILAAGCFVSSMSMRLIDPVVPDISRDLGVDAASVALLASIFAFPYALGQPVLGALGDAFGKARIIKIALAALVLCLAASAVAPTLDILFAARLIGGAAAGGIIPLAFAIVGDSFEMSERQVALSRVLTAIIAGQLAGSVGSGLIASEFGWRASTLAATALTFAALILTLWQLHPRPSGHGAPQRGQFLDGYREVFANPRTVVCFSAVFVEGIVIFGLLPYLAVLLENRGAGGLKEAGFVLSGFAIGGFIYTALVRLMLARLGLYNLIMSGGIVSGIGLALLSFGASWPVEMAIFVVVGVGFYMIHNSLQTQATELAPGHRASGVAAHAFFFFLGQAFGPLVYRVGLDQGGSAATLLTAGLAMGLLGVATAVGLRMRSGGSAAKLRDPPATEAQS